MHPEAQHHTPTDAPVVDSPVGGASRQLRASLEMVFQGIQMQNADAPVERSELRAQLRALCIEARRSGMRAEQLLVLIKDVWSSLPAGISRVKSAYGDERLNHVISTCVDEYYADHAAMYPSGAMGEREATP